MITSPYSAVTPEQELARLTLISSSNEAAIRRRSTISSSKPWGLGDINGIPVIGPLGPSDLHGTDGEGGEKSQMAPSIPEEQSAVKESGTSDIDSEATLVADSAKDETEGPPIDNKENQPPPSEKAAEESTDLIFIDTDEAPSHANEQPLIGPVGPPNHPPPVPPRPSQTEHRRQLIEEVEIGAQQDVTEVINNVLFQSECAIKPRGIAADGEQLDQIKE
jgi:ubiquitin carboxyl-terminal hydrolase 25